MATINREQVTRFLSPSDSENVFLDDDLLRHLNQSLIERVATSGVEAFPFSVYLPLSSMLGCKVTFKKFGYEMTSICGQRILKQDNAPSYTSLEQAKRQAEGRAFQLLHRVKYGKQPTDNPESTGQPNRSGPGERILGIQTKICKLILDGHTDEQILREHPETFPWYLHNGSKVKQFRATFGHAIEKETPDRRKFILRRPRQCVYSEGDSGSDSDSSGDDSGSDELESSIGTSPTDSSLSSRDSEQHGTSTDPIPGSKVESKEIEVCYTKEWTTFHTRSKRRHLYLYGPADTGKTAVWKQLEKEGYRVALADRRGVFD